MNLFIGCCVFYGVDSTIIIFKQIIIGGGIQDKSHVITSSYNHLIIIRTHRRPYGPCYTAYSDASLERILRDQVISHLRVKMLCSQ